MGCVALAALVTGLASPAAYATDGYFQYGYGARQKALGGAGAADSRDATAAALNPAGLTHVKDQLDFSLTLFNPSRQMTGGPGSGYDFTPEGTVESDRNLFLVPNFAWSKRVRNNPLFDVAALTVYGNGGMNTSYAGMSRTTGFCAGWGTGVFCNGKTGVDLQQAFISLAMAKKIAPGVSVGVAPIIARQQIKLQGLGMFAGNSSDPDNLSNEGIDESWGYGLRGGIEVELTPSIRIGVSGNTRIYMEEFDRYRGLFAEHGDFDIPATIQGGVAIDISHNLTFMADYKFINYSAIKSISNPSTNQAPLGNANGAGFGWDDVGVIKLGLEWRATPDMTLRVGYSHNDNPVQARDVMFNILAPGVVQDHFTAGAEFKLSDKLSLELAGAYVPESSVKGFENPPGNPGHAVEISMEQFEVTAGIKYSFDSGQEPLK